MAQKPNVLQSLRKSTSARLFIILVAIIVLMCIASPAFSSVSNLLSVTRLFAPIAIAGIGVCMVIITGGIDLSLGSLYGLAGVIAAYCMKQGMSTGVALILGTLSASIFGMFNGLTIEKIGLPPFIATLATMSIARSICMIFTQGYPITKLNPAFLFIGQGELLAIPFPIWLMAAIAAIFWVFLNQTVTGRRIYAVGGNEEATRISGVNTARVKILVYTLCSTLAGIAGIVTASKLGIGQPTSGTGFELDAIAAVAIGGVSMSGGHGTVSGTLIGAAIMGIIRNALVLLSIDPYYQQLIIGLVILGAVSIDQIGNRISSKKKH